MSRKMKAPADFFRSPCCRAKLSASEADDGGDVVCCTACGRTFGMIDDIIVFNPRESAQGEYSAAEMEEILRYAEQHGWRKALLDKVASGRPRVVNLITDPRRGRLLETLRAGKTERALDYGAGYGGVSLHLASFFREVVALDEAIHRIRFLKVIADQDSVGNITAVCHNDVERLPFEDNSFDAVVLTGVLEYLPLALPQHSAPDAQITALREIHRIVRPGGLLQIETKNALGWQFWLGARDHNGIPFASLLPLPVANRVSKALRGRPYRILNHGMAGYRRILGKAGWNHARFRGPYPGYQDPDHIMDFAAGPAAIGRDIEAATGSKLKRAAMGAMSRAGVLRFLVPDYSITARKD